MKSYIVRIYRHEKDNPRNFVWTIEQPHLTDKRAFTNLDEFWEILEPDTSTCIQGREALPDEME